LGAVGQFDAGTSPVRGTGGGVNAEISKYFGIKSVRGADRLMHGLEVAPVADLFAQNPWRKCVIS
jgi:hypothetical protein